MTAPNEPKPWHDNLPFPKHWLAYIVIKFIVLALAVYVVLRYTGVL
jgi:hypothetical protein